jgi:hypothetical protein
LIEALIITVTGKAYWDVGPDCALLRRIELDKFRVFEKEYRLSKPEKAGRITAQLFKSFLNLPRRASV